ncbi:MAG: hypothetical protein ACXWGZ_03375 [Candidatus Aminicenantales bacterium]
MMKTKRCGDLAWLAVVLPLLIGFCAAAQSPSPSGNPAQETEFKPYVMDHDYFSCEIPVAWDLQRDAEEDVEYGIYEIYLNAPAPMTSINVRYLLKDNGDFAGYKDFLERNSKNVLGETQNAREHYGPVQATKLGGTKAFELRRERMVYLHPESKSDESASLKEMLYIVPMKDGSFYVLHYTAEAAVFKEYLPVFERLAASFKPRGR